MTGPDADGDLTAAVEGLAERWRAGRMERQARRHLDPEDFVGLRRAGLWLTVVPEAEGGSWRDRASSQRPLCEALRRLAAADPSVALVAAMHPAVIAFWLANPDPGQADWEDQRRAVFASAVDGQQWGTITSEPGSGGDILRTKAVARPVEGAGALPGRLYHLWGDKHFGSGSGVTDWMMTTAVPDGETEPAIFVIDVRGRPWEGRAGMQLVAEWDGMGMAATQSHAMRLDGIPAVRFALERPLLEVLMAANPLVLTLFTAVIVGVLDEAIALSRTRLRPQADTLRAFEQVEWCRAEQDHWLCGQALDGALRAVESGNHGAAVHAALRAKQSVADLAEDILRRLGRVHGGGTFSSRSPFAHWFEDVRALGFLRPPWGLAFDQLLATSFGDSES